MSNVKEMPKPIELLKFLIFKNTILLNIPEWNDLKGILFRKNEIIETNLNVNENFIHLILKVRIIISLLGSFACGS